MFNFFRVDLNDEDRVTYLVKPKSYFRFISKSLVSKYKHSVFTAFEPFAYFFRGKQIPLNLVRGNRDLYVGDSEKYLGSNPIMEYKDASIFVETDSKFRYRNRVLTSTQEFHLMFTDGEAKLGLNTYNSLNSVW